MNVAGLPWPTSTTGPLLDDDCGLDWIWDREGETRSPEENIEVADAAWRAQAAGIVARSPFYRERFGEAGVDPSSLSSVTELAELPTMSKADTLATREKYPPFGGHLGVDPADVKRVYQTSGSSGRPSLIAMTNPDLETWTAIGARSYYATGIHPHHSVLTTFGAGPFVAGHTHWTLDRIGARRVPVGPGDLERVLSACEAGIVDTLLATPSFALYLASVFENRGLAGPDAGLRHLVVGGEPGGGIAAIRKRIEEAFGADVTEAAGIGDVTPSLFGECPMKGGMHFCGQGYVWPELINPDTEAPIEIEKGAMGEMVYTSLVREAVPVIRFRSGDIVEVTDIECGCGRTSFKLRIEGRADDMFIVRGVNVYPSAIQAVVADYEPAVTGRIRVALPEGAGFAVDPPIPVEVEVPSGSTAPAGLAAEIEVAIRSRLIVRATITFLQQDEFGDAGYKTPPVVRRPAQQGGN